MFDTAGAHNQTYVIQTFDASDRVTSQVVEVWNNTTSTWDLFSNTLFLYGANGKDTAMIFQTWNGASWTPVSQDVYTYFSNGKLQSDQFQTWNSLTTSFDATSQKTYYYDPAGNMITEMDNNVVGGSPIYTNQWVNTYTAANQLSTSTQNSWNGTTWLPVNMATYTYDTSGNLINALNQIYDTAWVNLTQDVYSNFVPGTHLPQTDILQHWDATSTMSWVNTTRFTNTYNSYNQLTSRTGESWNVVGVFEFAAGDPMTAYHYATYTSAVHNVSNTGGDARVYPVPAHGALHIDVKWDAAQAATIAIFDAEGRVVRQWTTPEGTEYKGAVTIDDLAAGMYFVKISGAQGQIVKSIVVSQ